MFYKVGCKQREVGSAQNDNYDDYYLHNLSRIFVSKSDYQDICKLNLNNETEILRLYELIYYLIKKTLQFFGFSIFKKRKISMRHGEGFKKSVNM